ncbi:MAG TPA: arylsulfatase, partial [Candidatus Competibacteraceae bacterium]|nr:arylsulfatase [Candidatus Competibacteraceae bacterium]
MKVKPKQTALLGIAVLTMVGFTIGSAVAAEDSKPNILFIVADDHGYGDIGAYGGGAGRGM